MSLNVCENCGHFEHSHYDNGYDINCKDCETDWEFDKKVEPCHQFKPDVFNMWELEHDE